MIITVTSNKINIKLNIKQTTLLIHYVFGISTGIVRPDEKNTNQK